MGYNLYHYMIVDKHGIGKFYVNLSESENREFWNDIQNRIQQTGISKFIVFGDMVTEYSEDEFCEVFKNFMVIK